MSDTEIFANKVMEHVSRVGDGVRHEVNHVRKDVACLRDDMTRVEVKQDAAHELYRDMKRRVESLERAEKVAAYERGKSAALGGIGGGLIAGILAYWKSHNGG